MKATLKVHFETLGCRLNQDESEGAARAFYNAGFVTDMESCTARSLPDSSVALAVINTCTVTGKAEQKARRIIRLVLDKCPTAVVIVTGCYAELEGNAITQICPERICILPGQKKSVLKDIALAMAAGSASGTDGRLSLAKIDSIIKSSSSEKKDAFVLYTPVFEKHSRASIKIQDGCNNSCTFCRIHLARGTSVSLDAQTVLERIKTMEDTGVREAVFTGVNLSQYAGDFNGTKLSFGSLLELLLKETSSIKFRVSSFYPQHITPALCSILSSDRVQPSFHLSIQSGSDRILNLMSRPYDRDSVLKAVELLRKAKNNPFISCDIIAGFPSETEDDFALTQSLCSVAQFSWIHAFPFSARPGTKAYSMKPQIPERIKGERVKWMFEKAVEGKTAYISSFRGKILPAIVENSRSLRLSSPSAANFVRVNAVTENFLHAECLVPSKGFIPAPGTEVNVRIDSVLKDSIRSGREVECSGTLVL